MSGPTRSEALAALEEFDRAKDAVATEDARGLPTMLVAWSALTALDYAVKGRRPRSGGAPRISAGCLLATSVITVLDSRSRRVQPYGSDPGTLAPFVAALVGWTALERLAVAGLRRSRPRRPNTAAGALLAVSRPVCYLVSLRLLPRPVTA